MITMSRLFYGLGVALVASAMMPAASQAGHRIIEASGQVMLQRKGWPKSQPARVGTQVNAGDRIIVGSGAIAVVRCIKGNLWKVPTETPFPVTYGCTQSTIALRVGKQSDNSPGGQNVRIPYVIEPRRTYVAEGSFRLRWNPAPGASNYNVRILRKRDGSVLWEKRVPGTSTVYPGNPLLRLGEVYFVVVEANNGTSSHLDEGASNSGFRRISPQGQREVDIAITALAKQNLTKEATLLAKADIYMREEVLSDAIRTLESLANRKSRIVSVYLDLGDLYRYIGLNLMAENRYQEAINLATSSQDLEGLAMAQAGLAEVKEMLGQREQVGTLLREALRGFNALGDADRAAELRERIKQIGSKR